MTTVTHLAGCPVTQAQWADDSGRDPREQPCACPATRQAIETLIAESGLAEAAARDADWRQDWAARDRWQLAADVLLDQAVALIDGAET